METNIKSLIWAGFKPNYVIKLLKRNFLEKKINYILSSESSQKKIWLDLRNSLSLRIINNFK